MAKQSKSKDPAAPKPPAQPKKVAAEPKPARSNALKGTASKLEQRRYGRRKLTFRVPAT